MIFCHSCHIGGKDKKHKALAATAVRRSRPPCLLSEPNPPLGLQLSRRPKTKSQCPGLPPDAAASTRKPRVKQGSKIYSFNSTNDFGGPASLVFGYLDPVAKLAAVITEKSPFTTPISRKDDTDLAKSALAMVDSDHLIIYDAYLGWKKARQEGD
ncbi:hypothetical protein H8958_012538 [Nasalis larvatus]